MSPPVQTSMLEIEQAIEEEVRAWNEGDAKAYSRSVAADCVFTNILGQVFVGKTAFEQQHARLFESIFKNSELQQEIDHLRLVHPDVIVADSSLTLRTAPTEFGPARTIRTKLLQLFVHKSGQWQIASCHNVEERPPSLD